NQPIALLLGEGEDPSALDKLAEKSATPVASASPAEPPRAAEPRPAAQSAPGRGGNGKGRIFASPLARRMAQQAGLDLAAISGSGPQGRIVKADIEAALSGGRPQAVPASPTARPTAQPRAAPAPTLLKERVL